MASRSLQLWTNRRSGELDEVEAAHAAIGGTTPGRRYATQQVNHAYAMLLAAQFQGFCRDLHSEAVDHLVRHVKPVAFQHALRTELVMGRKLDAGNPNAGNIGADFNRLGLKFWPTVHAHDARTAQRLTRLEDLNLWRNAIAHQDFDPAKLGTGASLQLATVQSWRRALNGLSVSFDRVVHDYLHTMTGALPW